MSRIRMEYDWNLRGLMASHQLWKSTDLIPLLEERGISLSYSQVHRLATEKPERLSLRTLAALCDIFECSAADIFVPRAVTARRGAVNATPESDSGSASVAIRPTRARITDLNR